MSSFAVQAAVDYFVKKKFGFLADIKRTLAAFEPYKKSEIGKEVLEIEAYKKTLLELPESELLTQHKQALVEDAELARKIAIHEERERFFNRPSANADFVHWSKAAHWTIDEAIALSFGKEPEIVTWKKIEALKSDSAFVKAFARRRDLALRASHWKKFGDAIPPSVFVSWANEVQIELPKALLDELSKIGIVAIDWQDKYKKLKLIFDELVSTVKSKQKPESTRKTENILKAFAAIAIDAYGYDPKAEKSPTPKEISDALNKLGVEITPQTIRGWLQEGASQLPAKPLKS